MVYASNLDYLFNYTTPNKNKPYNVDLYLYNYSDTATTFATNLPLGNYYTAVASVDVEYEDAQTVDAFSTSVSSEMNTARKFFNPTVQSAASAASSCPSLGTTNPTAPTTGSGTTFDSSKVFLGDIEKTDINVKINSNSSTVNTNETKIDIVNMVNSRVSLLSKNLLKKPSYVNKQLNSLFGTVSHAEFDNYLSEINTAIGIVYMKKVYEKIAATQKETDIPSGISDEDRAMVEEGDRIRLSAIANLRVINVGYKLEPLLSALREASKKTLYAIITKLPNYSANTFIKGFSSRANMTPTGTYKGYYYLYRGLMYDYFRIDKKVLYEEDNKVDLYSRKLLVDMFIKCCYPLIHFDLIDVLMNRYTGVGDFVNARFALLAKCLFTYNVLNELVTSLDSTKVPTSISMDFTSNLTEYIKRNNNGDINSTKSTEEKLKEIVIELHELSNKVVTNSDHTDILGVAISKNQLAMRNISDAIESRKDGIKWKYLEFYILIGIVILLISACGVLYFLEKYDVGIIIAGTTLVLILTYKVIMLIMSFITKN